MKSSECIKFCKHVFIKQVLPKFLRPILLLYIDDISEDSFVAQPIGGRGLSFFSDSFLVFK